MRYCIGICAFLLCLNICYADNIGKLHEYMRLTMQPMLEYISCDNESKNRIVCRMTSDAGIEELPIKDYYATVSVDDNNTFSRSFFFNLKITNLNYEGYNLATLMPNKFRCNETAKFLSNKNMKTIMACELISDFYHIDFVLDAITTTPLYTSSIMESLIAEHKISHAPLSNNNDTEWKAEYKITLNSLSFAINSYRLNDIIFDFYKREQSIALDRDFIESKIDSDILDCHATTTAESGNKKSASHCKQSEAIHNKKEYLQIKDVESKDYKQFLEGFIDKIGIFHSSNADRKDDLSKLKKSIISLLTKSNQHFSLELKGNVEFSMHDYENLINITESAISTLKLILDKSKINTHINKLNGKAVPFHNHELYKKYLR